MPTIILKTNVSLGANKSKIGEQLLNIIHEKIENKPKSVIQVIIEENAYILFGDDDKAPSALFQLYAIGKMNNEVLIDAFTKLAKGEEIGATGARVFVQLFEVDATHWGFHGKPVSSL
eukprot:TRINITY_DN1158_c0_g1_i1.p1 TRINITY_DN1158_c0_g1~~TRINITY_DN1158_c0_g1_i1.p1  ORF type:complete len:118 (-),score=29.81 TRINITY_DN1158_c0_g1_i1:71-424(-)